MRKRCLLFMILALVPAAFLPLSAQEEKAAGKDAPAAPSSPFNVGDKSQLFIDRVLVAATSNVTFNLVPAIKHPAVPWMDYKDEGPAGPMVLYDEEEKIFKSWSATHYNTSKDGLEWTQKEENPKSWAGIKKTWPAGCVTVIKDMKDPDPKRRYKLITYSPSGEGTKNNTRNLDDSEKWFIDGYNTYVSPDGREITHLSQKPILMGEDKIKGYYDKERGLFVTLLKSANGMPADYEEFKKRREGHPYDPKKVMVKYTLGKFGRDVFSIITSKDFEKWSEPKDVFMVDELDDAGVAARLDEVNPQMKGCYNRKRCHAQICGIEGPYRQESCLITFPRLLATDSRNRVPSEVQLAVSRDLVHWERPFRVPVIPRGVVGDNIAHSQWDSGWFNDVGPAMDVGNEVWVYYSARNTMRPNPMYEHHLPDVLLEKLNKSRGKTCFSGIGLAVWRRDRFVSVSSPAEGGTLITVPLVYAGNCLEVNADPGADGKIVVEIADQKGKTLTRSKPIVGNEISWQVEWETPADLAGLAGRPVALRFAMQSAKLYAFAFRKRVLPAVDSRYDFKGTPLLTKDEFGSGENKFSIDFVTIGNPGNSSDTDSISVGDIFPRKGIGRVMYPYRLAKYQVSYGMVRKADLLGKLGISALKIPQDGGMRKWDKNRPDENKPIARMHGADVFLFVNWLNTSTGHHVAYNLDENGIFDLWPPEEAWQEGGENLVRHKDAFYFMPTIDEYYKAASYDPIKKVYYKYSKGSDEPPIPVSGGTAPGTMVYKQGWHDGPADIDQAGGPSPYGTVQVANMHEFVEKFFGPYYGPNTVAMSDRVFLGGCWGEQYAVGPAGTDSGTMSSGYIYWFNIQKGSKKGSNNNDSFRVAARVK